MITCARPMSKCELSTLMQQTYHTHKTHKRAREPIITTTLSQWRNLRIFRNKNHPLAEILIYFGNKQKQISVNCAKLVIKLTAKNKKKKKHLFSKTMKFESSKNKRRKSIMDDGTAAENDLAILNQLILLTQQYKRLNELMENKRSMLQRRMYTLRRQRLRHRKRMQNLWLTLIELQIDDGDTSTETLDENAVDDFHTVANSVVNDNNIDEHWDENENHNNLICWRCCGCVAANVIVLSIYFIVVGATCTMHTHTSP